MLNNSEQEEEGKRKSLIDVKKLDAFTDENLN